MASQKPAQLARKPRWPIVLNATCGALLSSSFIFFAGFYIFTPDGWHADRVFEASAPWLLELLSATAIQYFTIQFSWPFFQSPVSDLQNAIHNIERYDLIIPLLIRSSAVGIGMLIAATAVGLYTYRCSEPKDRLEHIRGRQLLTGHKAKSYARHQERELIRTSGRGISVSPGIPISLQTETKHFMLVGASGGGKTQTLFFLLDQLIHQNAKLIVHDSKGDVTASFPDDNFILLAPHDARSWSWDIAKDCIGLAAARELAARLVPVGNEPMWSNGAQEILTGVIRSLQIDESDQWDWVSLRDRAFLSPVGLRDLLERVHPEGAKYIEVDIDSGTPNKTSFSFLVTMWSSIGCIVSPLASAWSNTPIGKQISLTAWLDDEHVKHRSIILQRSSEYADLSEAWIGATVQLMSNHAASARFGDSSERRIWMILDEFAQLGKLKGFQQFLEVGRSRGIRCALGLQDLEQLSDHYGQEALKTWLNTIETKIVLRMNAGPSAKFIAQDLIGDREVSWKERTISKSSGNLFENQGSTKSVNDQTQTATVPVVFPDYLERNLGPHRRGGETRIRALLMSSGNLYQLDWPITHWPTQRAASEAAPWVTE